MRRPTILAQFSCRLIYRNCIQQHQFPRCLNLRYLTTTTQRLAERGAIPTRKAAPLHGNNLPPRPPTMTLRQYVFSLEYLLRGLYRSLLIAVIALPLYVLWEGPIKLNHIDGEYEPFDLVERHEIAPGHSYIVLKRQTPKKYWWAWYEKEIPEPMTVASRMPIMSLRIKNPNLEIQRSYTPLNLSPNEIHLLVKRYPNGELSRYLHLLTPGLATVWVNQGRNEWVYNEGEWDHIVFVVGGTGITPAFQLCLNALQQQKLRSQQEPTDKKKTRFSILAATRDPKSILLREEFKQVEEKFGEGCLHVEYFVDEAPKGLKLPGDIHPGPITEKIIHETICPSPSKGWFNSRKRKAVRPGGENVMVLVCGPDGFTRYISGEHGGVASKQGTKGGLLANVEGITLFKLLESRDEDIIVNTTRKKKGMPVMKIE